eukprot:735517-Prorocentrum_minimum.AAC.1
MGLPALLSTNRCFFLCLHAGHVSSFRKPSPAHAGGSPVRSESTDPDRFAGEPPPTPTRPDAEGPAPPASPAFPAFPASPPGGKQVTQTSERQHGIGSTNLGSTNLGSTNLGSTNLGFTNGRD